MIKYIFAILIIATVVTFGIYQQRSIPPNLRESLKSGVEQAKKQQNLSSEEETLLKIQLALVDFISKHNGYPPKALGELVPEYFDSVPKNPRSNTDYEYSADGKKYNLKLPGAQPSNGAESIVAMQPKAGSDFINPNEIVMDSTMYSAEGKRDPFKAFDFSARPQGSKGGTPLERYTMEQLRLSAVLSDSGKGARAIIEDNTGRGYTVGAGTKIGDRNGVIVSIEKDLLKILETNTDFTGKVTQNVVEMKIQAREGLDADKSKNPDSKRKKRERQ
jgi:Tfp pilus assembly protein PilP